MIMIYLTSDTHAGHPNMLRFCNRPFATVEEMNETLISNWNSIVGEDDDIYHLGDIAFGSKRFIREWVGRLNGRIHLALGNHDYKNIIKQNLQILFHEVANSYVLRHGNCLCHLSHYPYLCWMGRFRFEPQFHGHVHLHDNYEGADRELMERVATPMQYDVGVDLNGFSPIAIDDAIERIKIQSSEQINCYNKWTRHKQRDMK